MKNVAMREDIYGKRFLYQMRFSDTGRFKILYGMRHAGSGIGSGISSRDCFRACSGRCGGGFDASRRRSSIRGGKILYAAC
jgi:hypothetical protein